MKKSQFDGIAFAVVEKFKAPIEKFNSHADFEDWASDKFVSTYNKNYGGRNINVLYQRQNMINQWNIELKKEKEYSFAEKFLILNGITKNLKPNDETICPIFNKEILAKTINELKEELKINKNLGFDFGQRYKSNLRKMYAKSNEADNNTTKWLIIPSKENDPDNFAKNIEKLQTLSCHEWCTKHGGANLYLQDGDIHIYLENGKPKLAIRFDEDIIKEVNSEKNDFVIPAEYIPIVDDYIKSNDFLTSERVERELYKSKELADITKKQEETMPKPEPIELNNDKAVKTGFFAVFKKLFQ